MKILRSALLAGTLASLVACTGTAPATEGPDGGGGGGSGQIHIVISGPVQGTYDIPFFSIGSRFGGPAGVNLSFSTEDSEQSAIISQVSAGWNIGYLSEPYTASGDCQVSNWNIGEKSGSGSFTCTNAVGTKPDGTYLTGITMTGNFTASQ
jgi:hypothetical protein